MDEIRIDMNVGSKIVLLCQLLHKGECSVQSSSSVHELDKDREGKVTWLNALILHFCQQAEALVYEIILRTAIQQGIVHNLIRLQLFVFPHLIQDCEACLHIAILAMTF